MNPRRLLVLARIWHGEAVAPGAVTGARAVVAADLLRLVDFSRVLSRASRLGDSWRDGGRAGSRLLACAFFPGVPC